MSHWSSRREVLLDLVFHLAGAQAALVEDLAYKTKVSKDITAAFEMVISGIVWRSIRWKELGEDANAEQFLEAVPAPVLGENGDGRCFDEGLDARHFRFWMVREGRWLDSEATDTMPKKQIFGEDA